MPNPWDKSPYPTAVVMYGVGVSTTPQPGTDDWEEYMRKMVEGLKSLPTPAPLVAPPTRADLDMLAERVALLERSVLALTELLATRAAAKKKARRERKKTK